MTFISKTKQKDSEAKLSPNTIKRNDLLDLNLGLKRSRFSEYRHMSSMILQFNWFFGILFVK